MNCSDCKVHACYSGKKEIMPEGCPMADEKFYENIKIDYSDPEVLKISNGSARVEAVGYGVWARAREVIEFCKEMKYNKVGIAFCYGLRKETKIFTDLVKAHGLEPISIICKNGAIPKEELGIAVENKIRMDTYEAACNPIGQAKFLNEAGTEFNVAIGLCVGHDSLFFKHSDAPVTVLIAKDRRLAHNPVGALYCADGYYKNKL